MTRQQLASAETATAVRPLEALNFFMADMQAGIGPFLGVPPRPRMEGRADRLGHDHRRCRRHGDDCAGRRAGRWDFT
jgi:hypothetical protein